MRRILRSGRRVVAARFISNQKGETKMFRSLSPWYKTLTRVLVAGFAVLACVSAVMAQAQSNAADLQGTVRDQNGAVVANAAVSVRSIATNVTREATTNDDGYYKIVNLPP